MRPCPGSLEEAGPSCGRSALAAGTTEAGTRSLANADGRSRCGHSEDIHVRINKGTYAIEHAILSPGGWRASRILRLHPSTYQRLVQLSKEAEREGAYRVAKRLQAVVLNSQGRTSGELAEVLQAPRSKVSEWLARYQTHGVEGLLEGQRREDRPN